MKIIYGIKSSINCSNYRKSNILEPLKNADRRGEKTSYLNRMCLKSQNKIRLKGELYGQRNLKDSPKSQTQLRECTGARARTHTHTP